MRNDELREHIAKMKANCAAQLAALDRMTKDLDKAQRWLVVVGIFSLVVMLVRIWSML